MPETDNPDFVKNFEKLDEINRMTYAHFGRHQRRLEQLEDIVNENTNTIIMILFILITQIALKLTERN